MDFYKEIKDYLATNTNNRALSYLGLTSKIEYPFRDDFAFYLHDKYNRDYVIAREYSNASKKRIDLAVLNTDNTINCCIEFKACYTFDLLSNNERNYRKYILNDYEKYQIANERINVWFILLCIRTDRAPSDAFYKIIKYQKETKRGFTTYPNSIENSKKEVELVRNWFSKDDGLFLYAYDSKELGQQFNLNVFLDYFVFKTNEFA